MGMIIPMPGIWVRLTVPSLTLEGTTPHFKYRTLGDIKDGIEPRPGLLNACVFRV